ncbi:pentatricopeptide repeat-containing protein [Iris pallida]|uniref:Pentatricopeptide repeat-containing protein n=1 Tax=Iris pallida TaxID=29817 RepID=A0AAX6E3R9_IRIPA|nr:pentatricopeptide repeat-containing protein [Iris pallida]
MIIENEYIVLSLQSCCWYSFLPASGTGLMERRLVRSFNDHHSDLLLLLRSCQSLSSLRRVHARLFLLGAEPNDSVRALLVNSYSSFRQPHSSLSVFRSSPGPPSVFLWNSIIRSLTGAGHHAHALQLYHDMLARGPRPDKFTFTFVLKACAGSKDPDNGTAVHDEIVRRGLQNDVFIATAVVDMYSKFGRIDIARQVFDSMPEPDVVAWNAMIGGLSSSHQVDSAAHEAALAVFRRMQNVGGVEPNSVTILNLFPAVCRLFDPLLCRSLHGFAARRGFLHLVSNGLMDAYSKCEKIEAARSIFDGMSGSRDDVSWATMISGYVYNGCFREALSLFDELRENNLKLNQVSVVSALSAAAEMGDLEKGADIHSYAVQRRMDLDVSAATMLVTMYARCGDIEKARALFDGIKEKDTIAWSAMISGFVQTGHPRKALSLFQEMQMGGFRPNRITIVGVLPACGDLLDLSSGKSIHCYALKSSSIGMDVSIGTALVSMYAQCGLFTLAHAIFDGLQHKEVVTWNALINGYAQIGDASNSLKIFHRLLSTGQRPDPGTMVGVLPACALLNALQLGASIHGLVVKNGFEPDVHVKNAAIDMYAKCADLPSAEVLFFKSKSCLDVISWNTMIAGYLHNGSANQAMTTFHQMRAEEDLKPNLVTFVSVIPAAAHLASLRDGLSLHSMVIRNGFEYSVLVGNSLIDMYSKCGRIDYAGDFFKWMDQKDIVSWNALLVGYATHGLCESAIALFAEMKDYAIKADPVSLLGVLSACRHGGLVEEGRNIFESVGSEHDLQPSMEHHACMVDLLGRAGQLDEAWDLIQKMQMAPDAGVWGALLGACRMHSNVSMGEIALQNLVRLEPQNPAHFVVLSNIYGQVGRWADARNLRVVMNNRGMTKTPGWSWL